MIDIILTVCQIANPDVCEPVRIKNAFEGTNLTTCFYAAHTVAARYLDDHPGYIIKNYGCLRSDTENG